jgi:uncharacterized membrane protein
VKTLGLVLAVALPAAAAYAYGGDWRAAGGIGVVCAFVYLGLGASRP